MDTIVSTNFDPSDAETITLGGTSFFVPLLSLRQVVKIGPLLADVIAALNRRNSVFDGYPRDADGRPQITEAEALAILDRARLTEQELGTALIVIQAGISKAHPRVTVEDLWELPARPDEIIAAINVVAQQSRMTRKAKPGEARAASR
jgi:hypothetical protein